ncbi:uncharacterized protein LOC133852669 [Alnus glutinosa]|uniref:uncharacterized protein LOC133852669 n=1 Tax=Alnus glutinosa TaxID=3517 RepID=UPI002D77D90B|nr:uncharacterized protein LOC133852669 [Alnus glutinosa]
MLKGNSFWYVKIPQNCSWCWRKILKLHGIARGFLKHEIGDGKSIHLWTDNWHPSGVLVERYGYRIVYDSQSRLDSRLDSVIQNGNCCWKPARSDSLVEIQSKLFEIQFRVADKPIWTIFRSGSYSSSDTWDFLRKKKNVVEWWSLVWFPYAIPKQAFLLWLTLRNRLTTGDRLAISSIVYGIWRARNEIKHAGHPHTEMQILKLIIWEVRTRIAG